MPNTKHATDITYTSPPPPVRSMIYNKLPRFEVPTAVFLRILVFLHVTLCRRVCVFPGVSKVLDEFISKCQAV